MNVHFINIFVIINKIIYFLIFLFLPKLIHELINLKFYNYEVSFSLIILSFIFFDIRFDLPIVFFSSLFGMITRINIPVFMRNYIYKYWAFLVNANLSESLYEIEYYKNLSELFIRPLKNGVRTIDKNNVLVSPVDGTIVNFGKITKSGLINQVKGIDYFVDDFLGWDTKERLNYQVKSKLIESIHKKYGKKLNIELKELFNEFLNGKIHIGSNAHYCVIYLAPGDYHRVHSPIEWEIKRRKHFPGTLFPVNNIAKTWIPKLFSRNERVVLDGEWDYGYFSETFVGAYNVGSIELNCESNFNSNLIFRDWNYGNVFSNNKKIEYCYYEKNYSEKIEYKKGDEIGKFNYGSTVVLIFDAPEKFKFCIKEGQKIKLGEKISNILNSKDEISKLED